MGSRIYQSIAGAYLERCEKAVADALAAPPSTLAESLGSHWSRPAHCGLEAGSRKDLGRVNCRRGGSDKRDRLSHGGSLVLEVVKPVPSAGAPDTDTKAVLSRLLERGLAAYRTLTADEGTAFASASSLW